MRCRPSVLQDPDGRSTPGPENEQVTGKRIDVQFLPSTSMTHSVPLTAWGAQLQEVQRCRRCCSPDGGSGRFNRTLQSDVLHAQDLRGAEYAVLPSHLGGCRL